MFPNPNLRSKFDSNRKVQISFMDDFSYSRKTDSIDDRFLSLRKPSNRTMFYKFQQNRTNKQSYLTFNYSYQKE